MSIIRRPGRLVAAASVALTLAGVVSVTADAATKPTIYGHRGRRATGPSTRSPPTGWPRAWAPTTSSPTSSRRRTTSSSRATSRRSAPPPTWPTTRSSPTGGRRRSSTATRSRTTGSPRTSRSPSSRRCAPRSACPTCASATRSTTAATRSRPSRRSSTCATSSPRSCTARSGSSPSSSTRRTSARSGCRWRSPSSAPCGATLATAAAKVTVQSFEISNLKLLNRRLPGVPLVQLLDAQDDSSRVTCSPPAARRPTATWPRPRACAASALRRRRRPVEGLHRPARRGRPLAAADDRSSSDAHAAGLDVVAYTFRNENQFLPAELRLGANPNDVRQRDRRVPAVLRPRHRRRVLRQPGHGEGRPRRRVTRWPARPRPQGAAGRRRQPPCSIVTAPPAADRATTV